jgi:hypothetical protein
MSYTGDYLQLSRKVSVSFDTSFWREYWKFGSDVQEGTPHQRYKY